MTKDSLERALIVSLSIMLALSTLDLILFILFGTAIFTVLAHAISLWFFVRYRLNFDFVKLLETSALLFDFYLINKFGYALASPCSSLLIIIIISYKKELYMKKLQGDLEKILSSKKDLENDKN